MNIMPCRSALPLNPAPMVHRMKSPGAGIPQSGIRASNGNAIRSVFALGIQTPVFFVKCPSCFKET